MQRDQVGGRSLALQSPVQARARSPPARQMPDSAQTAASTMAQMSKRACHQPPETNGSQPAATPPRRSPRPRLIDQPLSAPKSAADPHVAPPPAARATSTCPVTLDPTAVSLPSQHSSRSVLRRPVDSAQYCSIDYKAELRKHGILISMSGKGNCYYNAMVETFFKTLKSELVWRTIFYTRQEADHAIGRYIGQRGGRYPHPRRVPRPSPDRQHGALYEDGRQALRWISGRTEI